LRAKTTLIPILFCLALTLAVSPAFPCQTFMLKKGNSLTVGHNLGNPPGDIPGAVVINKRGVHKKAVSFAEILSGKPAANPSLEWVSKYGSVTFNPFCRDFPDGGMNEAGLFIGEMSLDATEFPVDESKPRMFMILWIQYVFDNFETVDQVVQSAHDLMIDGWTWHFFTADRQGNAAVIEFLDSTVTVYQGDDLPLPVLCNRRYAREVENLGMCKGFGGDSLIDLSNNEQPRFLHAAVMLRDYDPERDAAIDYSFKILEQFDRGNTQWTFVCDLNSLTAYWRTATSPRIKTLDLDNFDLSCDTPVRMLSIQANLEGNVEKHFEDYTPARNRKFVEDAMRTLGELMDIEELFTSGGSTIEEVMTRLAGYSEGTVCKK